MNKSDSIKALAEAYCKAQPDIEGATKDKTNPAFRSKYADLGSVVDAIKPALSKNGLSFLQVPHDADNAAKVETVLLHTSGEFLSLGTVTVPVTKHDAHGFGSALTYARRYGLLAAFGVAPEDDDGNAAAKSAPDKPGKGSTITPVTGMFEGLPIDMQNAVLDIVHRTESLFKRGDESGAWDEWSASIRAISDEPHGDIARAVAWNRMDSKVRTALAKRVPKPTKEAA